MSSLSALSALVVWHSEAQLSCHWQGRWLGRADAAETAAQTGLHWAQITLCGQAAAVREAECPEQASSDRCHSPRAARTGHTWR